MPLRFHLLPALLAAIILPTLAQAETPNRIPDPRELIHVDSFADIPEGIIIACINDFDIMHCHTNDGRIFVFSARGTSVPPTTPVLVPYNGGAGDGPGRL